MPTTTELTVRYLEEHPSIKDCLKKGVVNYSKLSRRIAAELGIGKKTSMEAILIACRRYAAKLKEDAAGEEKILGILRQSKLEIRNKIAVVIVDKKIYVDNLIELERKLRKRAETFYAIEGVNAFTVIVSEEFLGEMKGLFKRNIIKVSGSLAMITLRSPREMETTPGVVSYLYSLFGGHGINIVETMSCWTDTIFLVSEADIPAVMRYLRF